MPQLKNRAHCLSATLRRLALAVAMSVLCTLAIANPPCPSDLDGSGEVDGGDMAIVLLDWGACPEDPPSVTSVSPSYGQTEGGTTITITGTALSYARRVTIGGIAATNLVVVSDSTVTAVTPAGVEGSANIVVTTVGGSTASLSGAFTYVWFTVLEQSPSASVVTDATLRAAIAATGKPWRVRDNGTGIEMVLIPPGTFTMGCTASDRTACDANESPNHQVTLTNAFYMSRTEVTQATWMAKMGSNPSYYTGDTNRPVERVNWYAIQAFCSATKLRLPTEAEWEYAYRAGTSTAFHGWSANPNGTNDASLLGTIAWCDYGMTKPVAGKAANGFGLYDMAGNVWEWCADWYGNYLGEAQANPLGPASGEYRVLRGGWVSDPGSCRASRRIPGVQADGTNGTGFRVVRAP